MVGKRSLDVLTSDADGGHLHLTSRTDKLLALTVQPPTVRFPTGGIVGRHLVLAGVPHHGAQFVIWALDLGWHSSSSSGDDELPEDNDLMWTEISTGRTLGGGASWNTSVLWRNTLVVVGDAEGDLTLDFERRHVNFHHVALVDLEAAGIYQPPRQALSSVAQESALEALLQPDSHDFHLICSDGVRLPCNRRLLEDRWPFCRTRLATISTPGSGGGKSPAANHKNNHHESSSDEDDVPARGNTGTPRVRCTAFMLQLPEPSATMLPALRYFYTLALPSDLSPGLLSALLMFSQTYGATHLRGLAIHALHVSIDRDPASAAQVHEAAALAQCVALQIHALKALPRRQMSSKRSLTSLRSVRSIASTGSGDTIPPPLAYLPPLPIGVATPSEGSVMSTPPQSPPGGRRATIQTTGWSHGSTNTPLTSPNSPSSDRPTTAPALSPLGVIGSSSSRTSAWSSHSAGSSSTASTVPTTSMASPRASTSDRFMIDPSSSYSDTSSFTTSSRADVPPTLERTSTVTTNATITSSTTTAIRSARGGAAVVVPLVNYPTRDWDARVRPPADQVTEAMTGLFSKGLSSTSSKSGKGSERKTPEKKEAVYYGGAFFV